MGGPWLHGAKLRLELKLRGVPRPEQGLRWGEFFLVDSAGLWTEVEDESGEGRITMRSLYKEPH